MEKHLTFKVASHIVEDLGLNLYTSLPRVLVEFVANSYDADSPHVAITFDRKAIDAQRKLVKAQFDKEKALAEAAAATIEAKENAPEEPAPKSAGKKVDAPPSPPVDAPEVLALGMRALDEVVEIVIEDAGCGMSRVDLQNKFLFVGRRRRIEEKKTVTDKNRAVMGRKGLGKLAGFGVAKKITVTTREKGAATATKITMNFDNLVASRTTEEIEIPTETITDAGVLKAGGTRVVLSGLLYDPVKSREATIENEIADNFALIDPADFKIEVNGHQVKPTPRTFVYAWPNPDGDEATFVSKKLDVGGDDPRAIEFTYRMRFTEDSLLAADRGVRVYANKRLAAVPSLLDAETGMHGFRMTDYLDGVVHANFIAEDATDFISTDRHGLRWDAPALSSMRDFLSEEIKEACKRYQAFRDKKNDDKVTDDAFTKATIDNSDLTTPERSLAMKFARALARACDKGVKEEFYKATLPGLVTGISQGSIIATIAELGKQKNPKLSALAAEITKLTEDELDQFVRRAKARLAGIKVLKRIVEDVDFKKADNEGEIQKLMEKSPWLIDPTYTQFLSADKKASVLFSELAKELEIGESAPAKKKEDSELRPDLVFLIHNESLARVIIVELKSANKPLEIAHLNQLEGYIELAETWLTQMGKPHFKVEGHLLGTMPNPTSKASGALALRSRIRKAGPTSQWRVRDFLEVLTDTEAAHEELISIQKQADAKNEKDG